MDKKHHHTNKIYKRDCIIHCSNITIIHVYWPTTTQSLEHKKKHAEINTCTRRAVTGSTASGSVMICLVSEFPLCCQPLTYLVEGSQLWWRAIRGSFEGGMRIIWGSVQEGTCSMRGNNRMVQGTIHSVRMRLKGGFYFLFLTTSNYSTQYREV